jgi:hypothetical protein
MFIIPNLEEEDEGDAKTRPETQVVKGNRVFKTHF